jgi:F0F1-type ATP synthase membrane subunit b/b'
MEMAPLLGMMDVLRQLLNQFYVDLIEARAEVETSMLGLGRDAVKPLERAKEKLAACPATRHVARIIEDAISTLNAERGEALKLIDRALAELSNIEVEELVKCV